MSRSRAQQPSSGTAWAQHGIAQAHTYFRGRGRRASQAARREFLDLLSGARRWPAWGALGSGTGSSRARHARPVWV